MTKTRIRSALLRSIAALAPLALLAAAEPPPASPSPGEIVEAAPAAHWTAIAASDLLVMELAPDAAGKPRRVVIQLMPAPFSTGWTDNIRKLAAAKWWHGLAIVRVQDNYVVQWGDPDGEDAAKARPLPAGIAQVPESGYVIGMDAFDAAVKEWLSADDSAGAAGASATAIGEEVSQDDGRPWAGPDTYAKTLDFFRGWPIAGNDENVWPVHCYGMVGVGRNLSPDTGSGAELYTVIGHAPRHLDRNIALVGRVVEGIEHLSSLPRGTGELGFYETPAERTPIVSARLASDLPEAQRPRLEYLDSTSESFVRYAHARSNRKDAFFNIPAGGADICNIPVPIRKITQ
ncbi:cyclophilin type peptidyl-prolyl cis-trans isomerase/CLD family protein [Blastomonas sp. RAC04]|uniref:peptidylprolyl isomerase n=1 Tax=unclassified Blastomonas TaxID=2626550 RepID=UPI0006B93555|nr:MULTISPECIES: peptidylprolyl isomerase [unclassified Blastomonas]AOG00871.1 cyclophilin type peptidyl-prolyl cis-trans isomerase/CLD family protein [Blastomonas sp. RAC04]KPF75686.1 peptidylprolyl isomerase [Blastomonas sp. AAP25]